jgi:hydrogenase maturation protease
MRRETSCARSGVDTVLDGVVQGGTVIADEQATICPDAARDRVPGHTSDSTSNRALTPDLTAAPTQDPTSTPTQAPTAATAPTPAPAPTPPVLILGLGNDLLKDDAVGLRVAERLEGCFPGQVEVRSTSSFGLALLDELLGRDRVLLIDSYLPEEFVGSEIQERNLDGLDGGGAPCPHFVGLGEIREVMRALELGFPREVRILAIPVSDPTTFSYEMTPAVAARVEEAAARALQIVASWLPVEAT